MKYTKHYLKKNVRVHKGDLKMTPSMLDNWVLLNFLDNTNVYRMDLDFSALDNLEIHTCIGMLLHSYRKVEDFWKNKGKESPLYFLSKNSFDSGEPSSPAHHLNWKNILFNKRDNFIKFKVTFDSLGAAYQNTAIGSAVKDDEYKFYESDLNFYGVKNFRIQKHVIGWKNASVLSCEDASFEAVQKLLLRKPMFYVPLIVESENGVTIIVDAKYDHVNNICTYYEMTFSYERGSVDRKEIPDHNFQHWVTNFVDLNPKYRHKTQKYKKRKHRAPRKNKVSPWA